jgi:hypothetical protein
MKTDRIGRRRQVPRLRPLAVEPCERRHVMSGTGLLPAYDTGIPEVVEIWVDPAAGSDARSGAARQLAVQTLSEAWRRVPIGTTLSQGVRINLVAGTYPQSAVPHFWESRHGTFAAPVIIRAADGPGTARLPSLNIFDCRHLQLVGLEVTAGGGDVVQIQASSHVLLRDTTIRGTGVIATYAVPQEALKVNQSQHVYIENCDISGAWDNAIDFVAVQYGHVVGSRIHRSGDWAMYAKGGSAYLTITGNEFYDAGTGGFTAGQGTGFEFMVAPWLHYEASDIAFTNNLIHDVEGAGFGVNGGFNILLAHNTLVNVGRRSHVIEVVHGLRSCDGDTATCAANLALGGWGTARVGGEEPIPNKNVVIVNNVVFNPEAAGSQWEQFAVAAPRTPSAGSNIPSPTRPDDGLVIRGNLIWNGPASHPLGIASATLAAEVAATNAINTVRPAFADLARGDYRLTASFTPPATVTIPTFSWAAAPARPVVPVGRTDLAVAYDHAGAPRSGPQAPGAFTRAGGTVADPPVSPPVAPPPVVDTVRPTILAVLVPAAGLYRPGAVLTFTVRLSEPVAVTGSPRLAFAVGRVVQRADYVSGSGTDRLVFRWTVPPGLWAPSGIRLARQIALPPAAAIVDLAGNAVVPTFTPPVTSGIRILPRRR